MKLWQKEHTSLDAQIEAFTVGQDRTLDLRLAPFDILGSLAHVQMLESIDLLSKSEWQELRPALIRLYHLAQAKELRIEEGIEDIHSQVEHLLSMELGDTGKKIHSGRSRNDQVLLDLRLYFRAEVTALVEKMEQVFQHLLAAAEKNKAILLPGYTHLQVAMVSSFGLWFSAYAESLSDDLQQWLATYHIINRNPLGSAAGYGSSFPLDRQMTTDLLGFAELAYNVVHAQMGRGKTELSLAFALSATAQTLNKLATDICLFNAQNFGFIQLPKALCTGSSIMPHKQNPDVFELLRGRTNQLMNLPGQVTQLIGNLPSGYHRDFQLLKEVIFPALDQMHDCLDMLSFALPQIKVRENILDHERYDLLFSVEAVNREVQSGVPFRDAYRKIGAAIEAGTWEAERSLQHTHEGSMGNLRLDAIAARWQRLLQQFDIQKWQRAIAQLLEI